MENNELIKYNAGSLQKVGYIVNITNKLFSVNLKTLHILYLDDHYPVSTAVSQCIGKKFPNASWRFIQDGDSALLYVKNCFDNGKPLDLIITDIMHPGLNGVDFANAVRENEQNHNGKIPILFLSLIDTKSILQEIEEIAFCKYLNLNSNCEEINLAIQNLV